MTHEDFVQIIGLWMLLQWRIVSLYLLFMSL